MAELDDIGAQHVPHYHSSAISGKIKEQTIYWVMEVGIL